MKKSSILIIFLFSIFILVLAGMLIFSLTSGILKENREIGNMTRLYEKIEDVRLGMRSAIISQRDFTLTGGINYIEQYHKHKAATLTQLDAINVEAREGLLSISTFDSLKTLVHTNFEQLDKLIALGKIEEMADIEDYSDMYSSELFAKFSSLNKALEHDIGLEFQKFRSGTVQKASKLKAFLLSFYTFSLLGLILCFYLIYRQNNIRLELVQKLRESNSLKDKFFSIIAHDLRSPFSTLINLSEIIKETDLQEDDETFQDILDNIEKTSIKTFNLLNNLLQWANSQTGTLKVSKEKFDITNEVVEILGFYSEIISNKKLHITYPLEPFFVFADKNMLRTVLRNLIGNAVKFLPEEGSIHVELHSGNSTSEVLIIDNGPGLLHEEISRLFRLDVDTNYIGSSSNKGSGLGLLLCKEFIDKQGGKIFARTNPDGGCTFGFNIPNA